MNRHNPFHLIAVAMVLSFFIHLGVGVASAQRISPAGEQEPAVSAFFVSVPVFLRPCVEEVVKQWKKLKPAAKVVVLDENSDLLPRKENGPLIEFVISAEETTPLADTNATRTDEREYMVLGKPALAIYVNESNPLKGLTIGQIDAIFSQNRKCGFPFSVETFGQLGLTSHWISLKIIPFGISFSPYMNRWFQETCLCGGTLKDEVKLLDTRVDLFQALSTQPGAVGFYLFTKTQKGVRAVAISRKEGEDYFIPCPETIKNGSYPLSATLYARFKGKEIGENGLQFLKYCLSKMGQNIISSYGIIPVYQRGHNGKELPVKRLVPRSH